MRIDRLGWIVIAAALALSSPSHAQFSKATLASQIGQSFPDNPSGTISPLTMRTFLSNAKDSWQQYAGVNAQVGTAYTIQPSDYGQLVTFNNASPVAVTLSQPGGTLSSTFNFYARNFGTGIVTITPQNGALINGAASLALGQGTSFQIISDGTNYQIIGGANGPASTTTGDMAYWCGANGQSLCDAPFNWAATGGPSGNGQFINTSPGGEVVLSNDLTTSANSITFGGSITAGKVISLTFNYQNATGAARNITVNYTELVTDTLTTATTGFMNAFLTAFQSAPVTTDFGTLFRFFNPGTVAQAGTLMKFNFYDLGSPPTKGAATLTVTNNSTAGSTTTVTYNGAAIAIGATSPNPGLAGGTLLTLDVVPEYATSRGVGSGWAGVTNSNIFQWTGVSNDSAGNAAFYGLITIGIGSPTAGATIGKITFLTGNSTAQQGGLAIQSGAFLTNGTGTIPVLTYPGAINPAVNGCGDEGVFTFCAPAWGFFGSAVIGQDPVNSNLAMFGSTIINQISGNNFAIAQDNVGQTYINAATGQLVNFRIGNSNTPMNMDSAGLNLGTAGSLQGQLTFTNATSGKITINPPTGALGTQTLTLPDVTDTLACIACTQVFTNKTISGAANTLTNIGNGSLTNSSTTIGTTAISLGSSSTTLAGLTSITDALLIGGAAVNSALSLQATSGIGVGAEKINFLIGNNGATVAGFIQAPAAFTAQVNTAAAMKMGSLCLGDWPAGTGNGFIGNCALDQTAGTNYAFFQTNAGGTIFNASATQAIFFRIANGDIARFQASGCLSVGTTTDCGAGSLITNVGVQTVATTVAGLPACSVALKGMRRFVTDANANTFHTTAAGGGANNVGVTCDGTAWYISANDNFPLRSKAA